MSVAERLATISPNFGKNAPEHPEQISAVAPLAQQSAGGPAEPLPGAPVAQAVYADPPITLSSCNSSEQELAFDLHDTFYEPMWDCGQWLINDAWKRFHMNKDAWQPYGYGFPCSSVFPLARTFNAVFVLNYAGTPTPNCDFSGSNPLPYASCYASKHIGDLEVACVGDSIATTYYGSLELDPRTALRKRFFYEEYVSLRAATLFHEARHAQGWCVHTDSCPAGAGACDPSWETGCTGLFSSSGHGAYAMGIMYEMWFAYAARPEFTNATIRDLEVADANGRLGRNFERDPCFRVASDGTLITTC
jgi:hypothetical protein